ncbi:MAG: hypothetical protein IPJ13_20650 [Saprospiraceae bacterium]|nr:hypothetical protein [Saprospiraceae bacterium]
MFVPNEMFVTNISEVLGQDVLGYSLKESIIINIKINDFKYDIISMFLGNRCNALTLLVSENEKMTI